MHDEHPDPQDPLDLDAVDRAIRLNELHEKVNELGMGTLHVSDGCPPGVHEQFLENIIHYETAPLSSHFQQLTDAGVELPPPDPLDDAALSAKLWEVINALAGMDAFLCRTDHLSDRELYHHLWSDTLREESAMMPPGSGWTFHLDMTGSGSDEDITVGLRFYDDEEQRASWARDFPDFPIPPREPPPHDRDRHLPHPPVPEGFDPGEPDPDGWPDE